jgi:hypothetical protein
MMNKNSILRLFAINFLILILFQSCSKTDDATPSGSGSRAVKYEITGDFTGSFIVVAVVANGSFETFEVKKLPWVYEFTADKTVKQVGATATGSGGRDGQKASYKIYIGGKEVSSGAGTAIGGGIMQLNPKYHVF